MADKVYFKRGSGADIMETNQGAISASSGSYDTAEDYYKQWGWTPITAEEYNARQQGIASLGLKVQKNITSEQQAALDSYVTDALSKLNQTQATEVYENKLAMTPEESIAAAQQRFQETATPEDLAASAAAQAAKTTSTTTPVTQVAGDMTNPAYGSEITVNGQRISPQDPNYAAYYKQQYGSTPAGAAPAPASNYSLASTVEQQAKQLGNTSLANKEYVNATFKALHGRDATAQELSQFTGKGVLDVYNAIKAGVPNQYAGNVSSSASAISGTSDTTMTADNLSSNNKPTNLPSVTPGATPEIAGGAAQTVKDLDYYLKLLEAPETTQQPEIDDLNTKISSLLEEAGTKAETQLSVEEQYKIPQLRADYQALSTQIQTKLAEYEALKIDQEGKPITMASIIGSQAQIEKKKLAEIGILQARATGLMGQINDAQAQADRAVDLKYSTVETNLKIYQAQLDMLKEDASKEEAKILAAQQLMLDDLKTQQAEAKSTEKNVQSVALTALQNGADSALVDMISKAGSEIEAAQIAGQLLNSGGWSYVSTPAERDKLKAQGYEITQAGGRTYAKKSDTNNAIVQSYVNQINSGKLKLLNVPADYRDAVAVALNQGGGTPSGGGSTPSPKADPVSDMTAALSTVVGADGFVSPDDYSVARNAWIEAGYNPTEFDTKMKGFRNPNNPNYVTVKQ